MTKTNFLALKAEKANAHTFIWTLLEVNWNEVKTECKNARDVQKPFSLEAEAQGNSFHNFEL